MKHKLTLGKHYIIVGKTGSGKTVAALNLAIAFKKQYPDIPIIFISSKREKEFSKLIKPLERGEKPNALDGKDVNWPILPSQMDELNSYLWQIHLHEYPCVIVMDELMSIPKSVDALLALYTQGRALNITMIGLTQRPVAIELTAISQASYFRIFNLIGEDDLKRLSGYLDMPLELYIRPSKYAHNKIIEGKRLKQYYSIFYNVDNAEYAVLKPDPLPDLKAFSKEAQKELIDRDLIGLTLSSTLLATLTLL